MDYNTARTLLENLLDRIATDSRLTELITRRETDAIGHFLRSDIEKPPEVSSSPPQGSSVEVKISPSATSYEGDAHVCLDFGTAMSKAFAWDGERDDPLALDIGNVAGETGSPWLLQSTLFVAHDGIVHFGESAFNAAAVVNPEFHRPLRSIKDLLTMGQQEALKQPLGKEYNPTDTTLTNKEAITLYFAFLTDVALLALERHGESNTRRISRSYTKPVFDQERDAWATEVLTECASVGQLLADEFTGKWGSGIPISEIRSALDCLSSSAAEIRSEIVFETGILPEPVAAFVARCWKYDPSRHARRIFMVIDVGAGTTDFAMFAEVDGARGITIAPISRSVTTVRYAGDMIDNLLLRHLLEVGGITQENTQYTHLVAALQREIRLIKEELFEEGRVRRSLVNDVEVETDLRTFQNTKGMRELAQAMRAKFLDVLNKIDSSWLAFNQLPILFTGGGASLPLVKDLVERGAIRVGGKEIVPRAAPARPSWLDEDSYGLEDIVPHYQQLAVCIGGACNGAGCAPQVELHRSLQSFGGDIPTAEWEAEVVRKGR